MNVILADDTALRLARLGIELEERFGGPRDIEFAIAKASLGHAALFLTTAKEEKHATFKRPVFTPPQPPSIF